MDRGSSSSCDGDTPSIKSRTSIFTLLGLSVRVANCCAVTIGYRSYSSERSRWRNVLRGCHVFLSLSGATGSLNPIRFRRWA